MGARQISCKISIWKMVQIAGFGTLFALYGFLQIEVEGSKQENQVFSGYDYVWYNLRGDTQGTYLQWNIAPDDVLTVAIVNSELAGKQKIDVIKNSIISTQSVEIANNKMHKAPHGNATYYEGWSGALKKASEQKTKYVIPISFRIIELDRPSGDIIITLTTEKSGDGFSGYTKSKIDDKHILQSDITIYDIENISTQKLQSLVLHEFGHAIGLAHSTAPEDLMHPEFNADFGYISDCNIDAIIQLYDGQARKNVLCNM